MRSPDCEDVANSESLHEFHEDIRKLYVACTRAQDYLAVSLYRTGRRPPGWEELAVRSAMPKMALAELLAHTVAEAVDPQRSEGAVAPHPLTVATEATGDSEAPPVEVESADACRHRFSDALEAAGWVAGRPVETLPEGVSPYGGGSRQDMAGNGGGAGRGSGAAPPEAGPAVAPVPSRTDWERERSALWARAALSPVVAASSVAVAGGDGAAPNESPRGSPPGATGLPAATGRPDPGLDKDLIDGEAPAWRRGRYGTALGRAVHAVLQTAPFDASGDAIGASARRYAAAEGVGHLVDDVAARARRALESPVVREAARRRHRRELYAAAEVEGRLLEGFVDLLYEAADGSFVVVDYKTHASDERPDLRQRPGYRLQIAAYALMVAEATGRAVSRCVFVFLGPDSVHEVQVDDLPAAVEEVRQSLAADGARGRGENPYDPTRR